MSPEAELSPEEEQRIMEMVTERLKLQPEFIESVKQLKAAKTMGEALDAFEMERRMILEGAGPKALEKQHELGRLTARERVGKLVDEGTFRELDLWHRPYETGFNIGEERGRGDGVVIGYAQVGGRPISLYAQDATVMGGTVATVHARKINMEMRIAATHALANLAKEEVPKEVCEAYNVDKLEFGPDYIIPKPFDPRVLLWEAPAVAKAACDTGVARHPIEDWDAYREHLEQKLAYIQARCQI